jgi:hypothetical protein
VSDLRLPRLLLAVALCAGCELSTTPPAVSARQAAEADAAWEAMTRRLAGSFRAETPEKRAVAASYRTVSRGSALVETFTSASGNETITVVHRDGDALLLTHYCAQGNQAHLRATEASPARVVFELVEATNVTSDQSVMQRLTFSFREGGFDQESVYKTPSGKLDTTTLRFVRVP